MSLQLDLLPHAIAWIVHPLAGIAIAHLASVLFSRQGNHFSHVSRAAGIIVLLSVLGAGWVVHPAAGMLLGFLAKSAFHRWRDHTEALIAGLGASTLCMFLGAEWMIYPLTVLAAIWILTVVSRRTDADFAAEEAGDLPAALPEQGGGLPVAAAPQSTADAIPVTSARTRQVTAAPIDAFTVLHIDDRLPGDVRAQLVALDLRTTEALDHLRALGQASSEGAYVARAIREEYAPASVRAYLNLPRTRADVTPIENGKTGHDLLREQLDILLGAVQDILDSTLRAGGEELLTNQRFLQEKFGKVRRELDV
ncbi:hypothetical protein [Deinococcus sp.]|uniref:hypothetical protein n=1 Tax=Deinococcus sp. TaxID=47478 RepID=UPI0028699155|nr:hypothetical protein [Deinococcus sp.]